MIARRVAPGPGQESVWDYPRPPRLERSARRIRVLLGGVVIADSRRAWRLLETSHPPVYYVPPADVRLEHLFPSERSTRCESKGEAFYFTVVAGGRCIDDGAWSYPNPAPAFRPLKDHVAFYPSRMDACYVDGERVRPQPGFFYGGWITGDVVGPFKGDLGSEGW